MKNNDLIEHVAGTTGLTKKQARDAIDATISGIVHTVQKGGEVTLLGFGKFKVSDRAARLGRNPATGEQIRIAASRKLGFSPAKQIKEALAG